MMIIDIKHNTFFHDFSVFYFRPKARGIIDKINIDFILSGLKDILMLTFSRGCQIVIFQTLKD